MTRSRNRSQEWVGGWISRPVTTTPPVSDSQHPRAEAVGQWLSDYQNGDNSDKLDDQRDRCHLIKQGHGDWKENPGNVSFVILPFSRKVLPIMRTNEDTYPFRK